MSSEVPPPLPIVDGKSARGARIGRSLIKPETKGRSQSTRLNVEHGEWCAPGCDCKPPTPSLFEMAARRKQLREERRMDKRGALDGKQNGKEKHDPRNGPVVNRSSSGMDEREGDERSSILADEESRVNSEDKHVDVQDMLNDVAKEKQLGNLELMKGKLLVKHTAGKTILADACQHYIKALQILGDAESAVKKDQHSAEYSRWHDLSASIYLNLSLVGLLLDSFDTALRSAEQARHLLENGPVAEPKRVAKALFRCAKARIGLQDLEKAEKDLVMVLNLSKKNKEAKRVLTFVRSELSNAKLEIASSSVTSSHAKNDAQDHESKSVENLPESSTDLDALSLSELIERSKPSGMYLGNGGHGPDGKYVFGQTLKAAHILIQVPAALRASNVSCKIRRTSCRVSIAGAMASTTSGSECGNGAVLISGDIVNPVNVDESSWMLDSPGILHVELIKESQIWWKSIFVGHPEINIQKCKAPQMLISDVPVNQKADFEKAMLQEVQKTEEERERDRALEKAMEENRRNAAMTDSATNSNPQKKALYEHLTKLAPGVDVVMK